MKNFLSIIALIILTACNNNEATVSGSTASSSDITALTNLNADMRHIWSGGYWKHDNKEGFYRTIVTGGGYEHYQTQLYIQWLVQGSDTEAPQVLSTVSIEELNQSPVYAFDLPTCSEWPCQRMELVGTHTYEQNPYSFHITLPSIGRYQIISKR